MKTSKSINDIQFELETAREREREGARTEKKQ